MVEDSPSPPLRKRGLSVTSDKSSESNKRAHSVTLPDSADPADPDATDTVSDLGASTLHISSSSVSHSSPSSPLSYPSPAASSPAASDSSEPDESDDDELPAYAAPPPSSLPPPPPEAQFEIIRELNAQPLVPGDTWHLVSRRWYRRWETAASASVQLDKHALALDVADVGPVDNSDLVDHTDGSIRKDGLRKPVTDGVDVVLLTPAAHDLLVSWYDTVGPPFPRTVVSPTGNPSDARVEFYPPLFSLQLLLPSSSPVATRFPSHDTTPLLALSATTPLSALHAAAAHLFSVPLSTPLRLYRLPESTPPTEHTNDEGPAWIFSDKLLSMPGVELVTPLVDGEAITLLDALLDEEHVRLVVDSQRPDGTWSFSLPPSTSALPAAPPAAPLFGPQFFGSTPNVLTPKYGAKAKEKEKEKSHTGGWLGSFGGGALTRAKAAGSHGRGQLGLTGLSNLGNTCFMNSALQCMSNTKELQEYFISGVYKSEINRDNPLGMNGQVAEAFGQLLERLWASSGSAIPPREFKAALSKFAPSFSGYGQQDSQELLAFLLDGIHEDLNRIKRKPATEAPDWEGGGDRELVQMARTCWEQYRSRNDSVIVDLFQGQYRSTVVCPDCHKVSITFDPFMYVTVNLPVNRTWTGKLYVVPADPSRPRYAAEVQLPKTATLKAAKKALGAMLDVDPRCLVVSEEWKSKFWKTWYDDNMITEINPGQDTVVFHELPLPFPQPKPRNYGKTKPAPPIDPSAPILVAVSHVRRPASAHGKAGTRRVMGFSGEAGESVGSPFFVCLTKEEAASESKVYRAIAKQYARVSKRGDDLLACVEDDDEDDADQEDVVQQPAVGRLPADIQAPPSPPPGQDATMDDDEDLTASTSLLPATAPYELPMYQPTVEMPPPSASTPLPALAPAPTSTSTPAPAVKATPTAVPKPSRLFQMFVSKTRPKSSDLPSDGTGLSSGNVLLATRRQRPAAAVPVAPRPFALDSDDDLPTTLSFPSRAAVASTSTSTTSSSTTSPSTESPATTDAEVGPAPSSPAMSPPVPLLQTGDYIVAEWDAAPYDYYLGSDVGTWEDVTPFVDPALVASRVRKGEKRKITLEDCLNEFVKEERLGEDDTWYCPVCKKHQQATKTVELWKAPDILVFALKRFSASRYSRDKIDDFVDFPLTGFNMEPFVEGDKVERRLALDAGGSPEDAEPLIYDLYAVDNHYGGLGGGHYTAFAKNPENSKWYEFDDSRVSPIDDPEQRVRTQAAYLLFYRRRTTRPIGAKSRELVDSAIQSRSVSAANSDAGGDIAGAPAGAVASGSTSRPGSSASSSEPFSTTRMSTPYQDDAPSFLDDYEPRVPGSFQAFSSFSPSASGRVTPVVSDTEAEPGSPRLSDFWNGPSRSPEPVDVQLDDDDEFNNSTMIGIVPGISADSTLDPMDSTMGEIE